MKIAVEYREPGAVLTLEGDFDMYSTPEVIPVLDELLDNCVSPIVIDLSGVPFMDATGMGLIVSTHKRAGKYQGTVVLVAPTRGVSRYIHLDQVHRIVWIADTVEEALTGSPPGDLPA